MPTYLSPGVYVEEVPAGVQTIEGVGTSTAAFVGMAERGEVDKAKLITNFGQFVSEFGTFLPNSYLAYSVYSFFQEGGSSCYVVRVVGSGSVAATIQQNGADASPALQVDARSVGAWGNNLSILVEDPTIAPVDTHFKLTVRYTEQNAGEYPTEDSYLYEVFDNISAETMEAAVTGVSSFVNISYLPLASGEAARLLTDKRVANTADWVSLASGLDSSPTPIDYVGTSADKTGLHALDVIDDVNIVSIPELAVNANTVEIAAEINNAIAYCEGRRDCFYLIDPAMTETVEGVKKFKKGTDTGIPLSSSYAAIYYPWVYISDPLTKKIKSIPPSGLIAGIYAATDGQRGVHKAPAGIVDGKIRSAAGLETLISRADQDSLNPLGINAIRSFPNGGIVVWGARTISAVSEWKYVNIRRLMTYIKESVDNGTRFVVFEPNDAILWGRVRRTITAFLTRVWRDGALFGTTPEEAFYVKVDEENNPASVRDAGQLVIEVGVAPVKPAEFVVIKISQQSGQTSA